MIDEILLCAALLPLAESYIRNQVSTVVTATGATPVRADRCQADSPGKIARAMHRHSEHRGEHGRFDWSEIESALLPTQMTLPSADLDELVTSLPWEGGLGYHFRNLAHFNIRECVAVLDELDRQIHPGARSCCYVVAIGSRVCIGAISKGRSSSRSLLMLSCGSLPRCASR